MAGGGLKSVRLRAGADFVGTFSGTIRAGAGTAGVFMVAPVPIAPLTAALTTRQAVSSTVGRIDIGSLPQRL